MHRSPSPAPELHRASRTLRLAAIAAGFCALPLGASCVSVLDVGGYDGAASLLCALVERCYGDERLPDCTARVAAELRDADGGLRASWLTYFADNHCLESCVNARRCVDEPPLCVARGSACSNDWHCCGFVNGSGSCDLADGACCKPQGQPCQSAGDCCDARACDNGVCGGQACKPAGTSCVNGTECCTQVCNPQTQLCENEVCRDNGAECGANFDCCSGFCSLPVAATGPGGGMPAPVGGGFCSDPTCLGEGSPCDGLTPCCSGAACVTFPNNDGSYCWSQGCFPDGVFCTESSECCTGSCDPTFQQCLPAQPCSGEGTNCGSPYDCCTGYCDPSSSACTCAPDGYQCNDYFQCCSNYCNAGYCGGNTPCGATKDPCNGDGDCCSQSCGGPLGCCDIKSCLHNVCQLGTALASNCHDGCGTDGFNCTSAGGGCIDLVCAQHPACCCTGWTQACVTAAQSLCGIDACPTAGNPG